MVLVAIFVLSFALLLFFTRIMGTERMSNQHDDSDDAKLPVVAVAASTREGEDHEEEEDPLESLSRRLCNPDPIIQEKNPETSLSHIPWILQQDALEAREPVVASAATAVAEDPNDKEEEDQTQNESVYFPSITYLDLRRQQNTNWATARLKEGHEFFYTNPEKAESIFQQGLDLVPDHLELLISYGRLLAKNPQRHQTAMNKFSQALELEPHNIVAKTQLARLKEMEQRQQKQQSSTLSLKLNQNTKSSAYQNAMMERSLLDDNETTDGLLNDIDDDRPGQEQESDDDRLSSRRRRRRHRSKKTRSKKDRRHKKRRRGKRYYSDSSSSDSESSFSSSAYSSSSSTASSYDSVEYRKRQKRRRRRNGNSRRKKRRRKDYDRDQDDSIVEDKNTDQTTNGDENVKDGDDNTENDSRGKGSAVASKRSNSKRSRDRYENRRKRKHDRDYGRTRKRDRRDRKHKKNTSTTDGDDDRALLTEPAADLKR